MCIRDRVAPTKRQAMQRRDWTQKAWIIFIVGVITFVPDIGHAKADDDQSNIVLLNDAASALEDSSPDLSKRLTQFADHKEKEWEAKNANKDAQMCIRDSLCCRTATDTSPNAVGRPATEYILRSIVCRTRARCSARHRPGATATRCV